jgi:Flp pilus assembly protein TadD
MSSGREDWQNHRQDMQGNRQDWRTGNREDWQNWADGHINNHGNWYHGCWNGGWYPGAGWGYMWNNYPVASAFGLTAWGVNRMAYGFGYWGYSNPYYGGGGSGGYDYSQPLVVYADSGTPTAPAGPSVNAPAPPPEVSTAGMTALDDARTAFYNGDSETALALLDTAAKAMPNDTAVHEFRGLVLFALKRYPESAAATYAVLSAGPGWDWTTMSGLYASVDVYTQQLRALEAFEKANPKSPDAHFLLGYHYLTTGHAEAASKQFKRAQEELPNDRLLAQLVAMTTPPDESKPTPEPPETSDVPAEKILTADKLVGSWKASSQGAQFQLDIAKDGGFVWTYTRGKDKQSVKGVFAVDQNNLALEPDTGGTMLAEVDLTNPSQMLFKMISGDAKDPGLQFNKN